MKEMSVQQAVDFWVYLKSQEKLKNSLPRDEAWRHAAETYQELAKVFAGNFEQPISNPQDIPHGLTAKQAAGFLAYLDKEIIKMKASLERTRRNKQEALATVQKFDYDRVRNIYIEMEDQEEDWISIFENSRKNFMRILGES